MFQWKESPSLCSRLCGVTFQHATGHSVGVKFSLTNRIGIWNFWSSRLACFRSKGNSTNISVARRNPAPDTLVHLTRVLALSFCMARVINGNLSAWHADAACPLFVQGPPLTTTPGPIITCPVAKPNDAPHNIPATLLPPLSSWLSSLALYHTPPCPSTDSHDTTRPP
jgi:hypothetical protein